MSNNEDNILVFNKAFAESIRNVFETMTGTVIKGQGPSLQKNDVISADYIAIIGMNGIIQKDDAEKNMQGSMVLYWEKGHYLKMCNTVLETEFDDICSDISDFGLEISNITMGAAKTLLNPLGYKIEMDTPKSIISSSYKYDIPSGSVIFKVPFKNELTEFSMEVFFNEEA